MNFLDKLWPEKNLAEEIVWPRCLMGREHHRRKECSETLVSAFNQNFWFTGSKRSLFFLKNYQNWLHPFAILFALRKVWHPKQIWSSNFAALTPQKSPFDQQRQVEVLHWRRTFVLHVCKCLPSPSRSLCRSRKRSCAGFTTDLAKIFETIRVLHHSQIVVWRSVVELQILNFKFRTNTKRFGRSVIERYQRHKGLGERAALYLQAKFRTHEESDMGDAARKPARRFGQGRSSKFGESKRIQPESSQIKLRTKRRTTQKTKWRTKRRTKRLGTHTYRNFIIQKNVCHPHLSA